MFKLWSPDFKMIFDPFTRTRMKVLYVTILFFCDVLEMIRIVTSSMAYTIAAKSAIYSDGWNFHTEFSPRFRSFAIFLFILYFIIHSSRDEAPFWRLFIFYLLMRSRGRLVGRIYGFQCIVCTILLNVYFGKFVMTFIDIGEIGCTSIAKCHWMVVVVNLVKQIRFLHDAACWCGFVYAGSVTGFPAFRCDNRP